MTITLSARPSYTSLSAGAPGCSAPGGGRRDVQSIAQRSVSTILRQPVLEFKLGFLRVEMAG
jgi:hypothetical protein